MSDIVTPQAPTPVPAPANEVVVNQNPTNSPTPVGQQAPDKPVDQIKGSEHRPQSRREAIQAAFDKATKEQAAKAPKAEAKIGHNQPPEETVKETPKEPPKEQPRDRGRFASPQPRAEEQTQKPQEPQKPQPLAEAAPYREPPQRLSDKAKADWAATPESVRGDMHRMIQETEGGIKRYRADHEAMNTIRPYHELATKQGTTLDRALSNYVGMEMKLRADPLSGLDIIVNNLNLRTPDGRQITLRDIAHHIVSQTPEQFAMRQNSNAQMAQSHQMQNMQQRMETLEQHAQRMQYQEHYAQTRGQVDQFADTHPRFDELGASIQGILEENPNLGLKRAYVIAESETPSHAAQTRNPTTAQTRPADKSISGAPDAGPSNGTSKRNQKPVGRREAIQNAINRVNGSL
jgi:hypothetical protein